MRRVGGHHPLLHPHQEGADAAAEAANGAATAAFAAAAAEACVYDVWGGGEDKKPLGGAVDLLHWHAEAVGHRQLQRRPCRRGKNSTVATRWAATAARTGTTPGERSTTRMPRT